MWYVLQSVIMFAVIASNIQWSWTNNGYVAALAGILAAAILTRWTSLLVDAIARALNGRNQARQ